MNHYNPARKYIAPVLAILWLVFWGPVLLVRWLWRKSQKRR